MRTFFWAALLLVMTLGHVCSPACSFAAPFAEYIEFTQPDNKKVTLWGEGDEFHAVFETTTGHTVVFDPQQKAYFYAERSSDGKCLISTGVLAHQLVPHGLAKHVRMDRDAVAITARARRKKWDIETELSVRWSRLKSQALGTSTETDSAGPQFSPPSYTTIGTKVGLTLLIDFSDDPATVPQANIESFLNGDNYSGYGNNGSVKKYFSDVSGGRLTYTNVLTFYVRMAQPKSYYNDVSIDCGIQGRLLINDALAILKAREDYTSTILPTFDALTVDGSNRVVALNVFFAGGNGGVWSYGLWPHSWSLASPVALGNGKSVYSYQITNVGTSLSLGTFCHENGHMLCDFPDLYDYGVNGVYDSKGGAGVFSLMGTGGSGTNPKQVDAYLKLAAGWATANDITSFSNLTGALVAAPNSGYNTFYRYRKPGVTTEYFLLENRQKTGRDSGLPAAGIAVWHVDQLGNRDNQSLVPNSTHQNYELTLVQADNLWDFQNNTNSGDKYDLYYLGNSAAAYTNTLTDASSPNGHWWDGSASGISLNNFSTSSMSMTFNAGVPATAPGAPTIVSVAAGNTMASIAFAPPVSNGGSAITGYTVTPNSGLPVSGDTVPIVVTGLTNGISYTFIIKATNAVGTGPASAVSAAVTPGIAVIYDAYETGYQLLQSAYNNDFAGKKIMLLQAAPVGGLTVGASNLKGEITVRGGYNNTFTNENGTPSILNSVTLSAGRTNFQNVIIKAPSP
jgi:M6 family metalloprotease-like protein